MYLKNNSEKFQCGLKTKKEVLTINPGEAVHVFDSDIIFVNSVLVQITEAEYNELQNKNNNKKDKVEKTNKDEKKKDIVEQKAQNKQKADTNEKDDELTTVQKETVTGKDEVKEEKTEEKTEEKPEEKSPLEKLEQELQVLKQKWEETDKPGKKSQIQKRIKEVQNQINNLK